MRLKNFLTLCALIVFDIFSFCYCRSTPNSTGLLKKQNETFCYVTDNDSQTDWLLIWESHFRDDDVLSKWKVEQEGVYCSGNNVQAESCNTKENVFIHRGAMVLAARHKNHYTRSFTGARVTSPLLLPNNPISENIRFEVRAAMPVGTQIFASIFAVNKSDTYEFGKYSWFELATNRQQSVIGHGAHFYHPGAYPDVQREYTNLHLNHFQKYELTVNRSHSSLGVNGNASFVISNIYPIDLPSYNLIFVIGVGGAHFRQPVPVDFSALKWICPALVIDYVRVYEQTSSIRNPKKCPLLEESSNEMLDDICVVALEHSVNNTEENVTGSNVSFALITCMSIILILSFGLFAYLFIRSGKFSNTRMQIGNNSQNNEDFSFIYNRTNGESLINNGFDGN